MAGRIPISLPSDRRKTIADMKAAQELAYSEIVAKDEKILKKIRQLSEIAKIPSRNGEPSRPGLNHSQKLFVHPKKSASTGIGSVVKGRRLCFNKTVIDDILCAICGKNPVAGSTVKTRESYLIAVRQLKAKTKEARARNKKIKDLDTKLFVKTMEADAVEFDRVTNIMDEREKVQDVEDQMVETKDTLTRLGYIEEYGQYNTRERFKNDFLGLMEDAKTNKSLQECPYFQETMGIIFQLFALFRKSTDLDWFSDQFVNKVFAMDAELSVRLGMESLNLTFDFLGIHEHGEVRGCESGSVVVSTDLDQDCNSNSELYEDDDDEVPYSVFASMKLPPKTC